MFCDLPRSRPIRMVSVLCIDLSQFERVSTTEILWKIDELRCRLTAASRASQRSTSTLWLFSPRAKAIRNNWKIEIERKKTRRKIELNNKLRPISGLTIFTLPILTRLSHCRHSVNLYCFLFVAEANAMTVGINAAGKAHYVQQQPNFSPDFNLFKF